MKQYASSKLLLAALLASVAFAGCKKKDKDQADANNPTGTTTTKSGDPLAVTPGKGPDEGPKDGNPTVPDSTPGVTPPDVTALNPTNTPSGKVPGDSTGGSTKDPQDKPPTGETTEEPEFVPGEVSEVDADDLPTTETLLGALPPGEHTDVLKEGVALSDEILLALEGAADAPAAIAALQALDPKFAEVAERMASLGNPDNESTELFSEVLRSKQEFNNRVRAAMDKLKKLDTSLPPDEAGKKVNLESAAMYRALTSLFGHYQKAWPTVRP